MALQATAPKGINWWIWGGVGLAVIAAIVAALYGFDVIGGGAESAAVTETAPAVDPTPAPAEGTAAPVAE